MKIFVGNLSWDATEDALRQLFEGHGEVVSVRIVQDPYTGRSKGFGFVEMKDEAGCSAAIDALNDADFIGRPLRVSRAQEQGDRPRSTGPRGGDRGGDRGGPRGGDRGNDRGPRKPFRSREDSHYN
ncbi:MAG: RNA-binding protein [Chlamydiia bacterium]|nr:RNA-binding protein [Chlamydiia bacterium]